MAGNDDGPVKTHRFSVDGHDYSLDIQKTSAAYWKWTASVGGLHGQARSEKDATMQGVNAVVAHFRRRPWTPAKMLGMGVLAVLIILLLIWLVGCKQPAATKSPPAQVSSKPAEVREQIVAGAKAITGRSAEIEADAKIIITVAGENTEIVGPASRILVNAGGIHTDLGVILGTTGKLKEIEAENKSLASRLDKANDRADKAESAAGAKTRVALTWISIACFAGAFVAGALGFTRFVDTRLAIAGFILLLAAGGFFGAVAEWFDIIIRVCLGVVGVAVAYGVYWMWKSGWMTPGSYMRAAELFRAEKWTEALNALCDAEPDFKIAFESLAKKDAAGQPTVHDVPVVLPEPPKP